ncbi:MAG: extracellular solute-binding protein [Bdellovibrionales bacterium]|nr:extracellular solute-binding protein [Bdellovibrionales bacterium]MBT3524911.1 extracellular solute-binding protein [Bdellovibrionales bacterium]MBT7670393.1 extracellular solute-binding protein [Bdellovibrionales bacterium]
MRQITSLLMFGSLILCIMSSGLMASELKLGIMQDRPGVAAKYAVLKKYLKVMGIELKLKGYRNYRDAAVKFANGDVDAMFAGSGVAGTMMIKGLATPLVRPVHQDGWSTYWAVVIAPQGIGHKVILNKKYLADKKIICSALASSGEFFARSILGQTHRLKIAGSHGMAVNALAKGAADIAIVKNWVWETLKGKYPNLEQVGKDSGENPNGTMIVSKKIDPKMAKRIKEILLNIEADSSTEAVAVKTKLKIRRYIVTNKKDFEHTLKLLAKAGVTPEFKF